VQLEQSGGGKWTAEAKFRRWRKAIENKEDVRTATNAEKEKKKKRSRHHDSPADRNDRQKQLSGGKQQIEN